MSQTREIQVYNTLTGKKETFEPMVPGKVTMYACGPTVYMLSHLGHARMAIVWDTVQRFFRFCGYEVTYVRNITDVDDKIIARAKSLGISPERLARECTYDFWHDMRSLNVQFPDYEPRATEYIQQMIGFVEGLIARGHAYVAQGDVYFDVQSFAQYGKLGKQNLDALISGARDQAVAQEALAHLKKSPVDFALWKSASPDELNWPSPWGPGRPGWHLECSTMVKHILGPTIDIHAGGEDLVFPHHENEIAQSEALHAEPLARYWLHNSFVQVSAEKMSKSLGNFKTIRDLLEQYSPDTIRLFVLQSHYRSPIDFTIEALNATRSGSMRLIKAAAHAAQDDIGADADLPQIKQFAAAFAEAMSNDFNTAVAISQLYQLSDAILASKSADDQRAMASALKRHAAILGLSLQDTRTDIDRGTGKKLMDLILTLRQEARGRKDYASADLIRKSLGETGINVMDGAGGASWEIG